MQVGDTVKVVRCDACEVVIGKLATVRSFSEEDSNLVALSFGKGRPQQGRPHFFNVADLLFVCSKPDTVKAEVPS